MSLGALKKSVESKTAKLGVIGLGYVGLPVAVSFAQAGFDVLGVDIVEDRVKRINAGQSPIEGDEPGLSSLLTNVVGGGKFRATTDYASLSSRDIILINVETPVDDEHKPRYEALRNVLRSLGPVLANGTLVIIESTISPGTMGNVVLPLIEESSGKVVNQGFYLGHCPERVMPGKLLFNLRTLSRVVGGMTPETAETMVDLYRLIVEGDLDPTDCLTAELVKTVENAYRDVQIAFANEVGLACEALGGDVWKVRQLVNKSPGRNMLLPGAGVGGHCIPKDPWLLAGGAAEAGAELRLIPAARAVNDSMPFHMVELLEEALANHGRRIEGSRILVMGYAYLENSDDTRNSPSEVLIQELDGRGAEVVVQDPFVEEYQGDLLDKVRGCDGAVLMVKHQEYSLEVIRDLLNAEQGLLLIDGRGILPSQNNDFPAEVVKLGVGSQTG